MVPQESSAIATVVMIAVLVAMLSGASVSWGEDLLSESFDDGDLTGWTASGAGKWEASSAARPDAAYHSATGQPGQIEHSLSLDSPEWSVRFDANWRWGTGNAGLFLSVWLLDESGSGYQARVIQNGDLHLRRIDKGSATDIAGPFNIGKLVGGPKLRSFRVNRSAAGVLTFEFRMGDRWFNALSVTDSTYHAFTKIRLCEDTGKGCAIFDNLVVSDAPSPKQEPARTAGGQPALLPVNVERFYVQPDVSAELIFCLVKAPSSFFNGSMSYYITDYRDRYVTSGQARWNCGVIKLPVTLRQGYYTLTFPAAGQSFGIHATPPADGEADLFFGVDSAMSWFIKPRRLLRENLVRVLKRNGICSARGRVSWNAIEPEKGEWVWDGDCQYETLRKLYVRYGIQLLDMCEITPKWNDPDGGSGTHSFLQDLTETVRSWETISRRWEGLWSGFEVWNEPDNNSFFNGGTHENRGEPADQYTQFAKAVSYAFHRAGVKTPLVGGCFSISVLGTDFSTTPSHYHRLAAQNGLLDCVDAVSFHSYSPPPEIQAQVAGMRGWLEENGKPSMPVYLTESGVVPWSDGDTVLTQTAGLAMKMIEAKVCGVARFYAFVYPPLPGGKDWRFGIMNYNGSPRHLMAGFVQAAHALSHRPYIGDLRHEIDTLKLARVFGGPDDAAAVVLFTGRTDSAQTLKLDLPTQRIEGVDGRVLKTGADGTIPIPDGLVYVYVKRADLASRLAADTPAMRLWKLSRQAPPPRSAPSPIIIQPRLDQKLFPTTYTGYRVLPEVPADRLPIAVEVFNLSDRKRTVRLTVTAADAGQEASALAEGPAEVPPMSSKSVAFEVDITQAYRPGRKLTLRVDGQGDGLGAISPLVIDLEREPGMREMMAHFLSAKPLPITELDRWSKDDQSDARFSRTEEGHWRMDGKNSGSYAFSLPEGTDLTNADGFVIRVKCLETAKVWFSALDANGRSVFHYPATVFLASDRTYQPSDTFIHPDGEWHVAYVPLAGWMPSDDGRPAGASPGLVGVERIQLGLKNLSRKNNSLTVSDLLIVREK